MKKTWMILLCLLVLSGCGKARQSALLQEQYAAISGAELTAEITVHLPEEFRQYQVSCTYKAGENARIVITAPEAAAGIQATVSDDDLTLSYEDLTLSAGVAEGISPVNCLPWMLKAAASGYVLEEGRETVGERDCLRVAFDTTGADGEKVLCTTWFDRDTLAPVCSEFSLNGALRISVKVISFTSRTDNNAEP